MLTIATSQPLAQLQVPLTDSAAPVALLSACLAVTSAMLASCAACMAVELTNMVGKVLAA